MEAEPDDGVSSPVVAVSFLVDEPTQPDGQHRETTEKTVDPADLVDRLLDAQTEREPGKIEDEESRNGRSDSRSLHHRRCTGHPLSGDRVGEHVVVVVAGYEPVVRPGDEEPCKQGGGEKPPEKPRA